MKKSKKVEKENDDLDTIDPSLHGSTYSVMGRGKQESRNKHLSFYSLESKDGVTFFLDDGEKHVFSEVLINKKPYRLSLMDGTWTVSWDTAETVETLQFQALKDLYHYVYRCYP